MIFCRNGYIFCSGLVLLDMLQRKQYFSFVEKKQHDFISSYMKIYVIKNKVKIKP